MSKPQLRLCLGWCLDASLETCTNIRFTWLRSFYGASRCRSPDQSARRTVRGLRGSFIQYTLLRTCDCTQFTAIAFSFRSAFSNSAQSRSPDSIARPAPASQRSNSTEVHIVAYFARVQSFIPVLSCVVCTGRCFPMPTLIFSRPSS